MSNVLWNGNVEHIEEHGLTVEDVEYVLEQSSQRGLQSFIGLAVCVWLHAGRPLRHRDLRSD